MTFRVTGGYVEFMVNSTSYLLSLLAMIAFFSFFVIALARWVRPHLLYLADTPEKTSALDMFLFAAAWPLGVAARGFIAAWFYYIDINAYATAKVTFGLGALLLIWACVFWRKSLSELKLTAFFKIQWRSIWTYAALAVLALSFLFHFNFLIFPWYDHDEAAVYGYLTEMIAQGWTYIDGVNRGSIHDRPLLAQALDAQLYGLIADTVVIRFTRLMGLVFVALSMLAFLRIFFKFNFWMLLIPAAALTTPELRQYLGVSLKIDSVVLSLEFTGLLFLCLATYIYLEKESDRSPQALAPLLVSFLCFLGAYSCNLSGIYSVIVSFSFLAYLLFRYREIYGQRLAAFGAIAVIVVGLLGSPTYVAHIRDYANPIFPFKAPFPFHKGEYTQTLDKWRGLYNIQSVPHGLLQPYALFHLGLGLENRNWPIHAHDKTVSMNWLSPLIILMLLVPLLFHRHQLLKILGSIFFIELVLWSMGLHYSRAFLPTSFLGITAVGASISLSANDLPGWQDYLRKGFILTLLVVLAWLTILPGYRTTFRHFASVPFKIFNAASREYLKVEMLAQYAEDPVPTEAERRAIETIITHHARPRVQVAAPSGRVLHILFEKGLFTEASPETLSNPQFRPGHFLLINRKFVSTKSDANMNLLNQSTPCFESADKNWVLLGDGC